ncbi:branched-chain-amino-acid transaminase [Brevibacillus laterosporus]|uniref:branched-chain-amino-acid transaminase n=1 Tax=Brevibacillus laterosporus TaxID=1465 RepID=UPI0003698399|nr:branched-chain-amino-acid transaminase [Brevibacillus laterosporus]ATO50583.1 branched-chain-amino-acid transaminase [Brevibacillus laterosporus DSM 25]AYB39222.1 branched-chain-amino-acid transaminase [Brevibacillus laterosporus]MBG9775186.1 branched-chain amino acid aminotransferase [Brevibacillus laterosporus]MBG9801932.1 branched-chain amino acid aminotransferase [Brevibacillus laterosporus]MBM7108557.1 Branched-chain-amino-acid aminotransferase [Brevibacillus laterosporus]
MTQQLIYLNGKFVEKENAKISVYDHGFLYGDGIFEGIRVYNGNVFRLQEHIERLYESALSIMLVIPMKIEEMMDAVVETVRKNELRDAYIRLVISRGDGDLGLDPRSCKKANIVIIVEQLRLFPQELYETGLKIVTVPTRRNKPDALNPKIKSLNYLNNVMVRMEASMAGVSEALMLNSEGYVTEGSGDNIFLVKKGVIYTPPTYLGALDGITRQAIMDIARELGYVIKEEPFTRHDVYIADEVFLTGTAAEVISVSEVDARIIRDGKPGPVTKQLLEEFRRYVQEDGVKVYE